MADTTSVVRREAEPLAAAAGVDLVDVEVRGSGPRSVVRIVVGRKGGVDLAACRDLSKSLSAHLDAVDPVVGAYALEVTSPGVDHPLRHQRDFDRVEGRRVRVERRCDGDAAPEVVEGTVGVAGPDTVEITAADGPVAVSYSHILTARQVLPW